MSLPKGDYGLRLRGYKEFRQFLNSIKKGCGSQSKILRGLGSEAVDMIRTRTIRGVDIYEHPFKPVSKEFQKKKGTSKRNLSSTGNPKKGMLGAIRKRIANFKIIIYVDSKERKNIISEVHHAGMISGRKRGRFRMPRSAFFGLTGKEKNKLWYKAYRNFMQFINKYNRKFWRV